MNSHSSLHIPRLTPSVSCFIQTIWRAKQESTTEKLYTACDVNMQGFVKFDDYQLLPFFPFLCHQLNYENEKSWKVLTPKLTRGSRKMKTGEN